MEERLVHRPPIHELIDDRFEILDTLGRGGMGVVYRARDRERGVEVALKTLRGVAPQNVMRFKTEFRALCDIRHPNLVELGELFETGGTWYFTMELVRGASFLDHVRGRDLEAEASTSTYTDATFPISDGATDEGPTAVETPESVQTRDALMRERRWQQRLAAPACDLGRLREALAGLARGLGALHAAGKVHRDLKPSNILVERSGRVVVLDFGVVAELDPAIVDPRKIVGTVTYMAPEQARGEAVGPAADWYAVGVLAYCALTGRKPFAGVAPDELLVLKQQLPAPPMRELADGIPDDLERLCTALLERDVAARPSESEIFDVLGVDLDDDPATPALGDASPAFVGRRGELDALEAALIRSRSDLACVVVEGESGIGKSALVQRFVELARAANPRVAILRGRCHRRERVPFNAVDGVIDELARFLVSRRASTQTRLVPDGVVDLLAVFPALRTVPAFAAAASERASTPKIDRRGRAFAALREVLARVGRRRPVIVAIDDLQWADTDSMLVLDELLRRDAATPLCLIATMRAGDGHHVAQRIAAAAGAVHRVELAGLDERDAEELVRLVARDDVEAARARHVVAESRGHPLFLRELVRHEASGVSPHPTPLTDVICARVRRLDPAARQLLAVAAVAGARIPRQVAYAAAHLATTDGELHLATLAREYLVRVHGARPQDDLEPFHDRVREAVCGSLGSDELHALHAQLASALEAVGAPPGALLPSYEAAGDRARSAQLSIAAADEALRAFAFGRAAELLRRALELAEVGQFDDAARSQLLERLAEALANDGKTAEAAAHFSDAAALAPDGSARQLDLLRRAAERFLMGGNLERGFETAHRVLARLDMKLPSRSRTIAGIVWNQLRTRGRALAWAPREPLVADDPRALRADICWSLGAGLGMVDSLLGAYFSGRAARFALAYGRPLQIARSLAAATIGASLVGRRERAQQLLEAATRAATEDGSPLAAWYAALARTGTEFLIANDFVRCAKSARALESDWYAAGQGPGWETDVAMHFSLASQQMLGEYPELARRVSALVQQARRNGDLFQEVTLRVRFAVRHLLADRPDLAGGDVIQAMAAWLPGTNTFGNQRAWALWSRTRIELYAGRLATLGDTLDREWSLMRRSLVGRIPVMRLEWGHTYGTYLLGRALAARDRSHKLALCRAADKVARTMAQMPYPAAPVSSSLLAAATASVRGDADVVDKTRHALAEAQRCGVHAFAAATERRLGEALGGSEGAAMIARADDSARKLGFTNPERAAEMAMPTARFAE